MTSPGHSLFPFKNFQNRIKSFTVDPLWHENQPHLLIACWYHNVTYTATHWAVYLVVELDELRCVLPARTTPRRRHVHSHHLTRQRARRDLLHCPAGSVRDKRRFEQIRDGGGKRGGAEKGGRLREICFLRVRHCCEYQWLLISLP